MVNFQNLTPEQCVLLAKFLYPNIEWEFYPKEKINESSQWKGFDLISLEKDEEGFDRYILQIGFDGKVAFFEDLQEFPINQENLDFWINHHNFN